MNSNNKKLFIGVDEAGYGPNLGPLIVAASVWLGPEKLTEEDICEAFSKKFSTKPWTTGCKHVPLGDSKKLYQPRTGLTTLETGLLTMLKCQGSEPAHLAALLTDHCSPAGPTGFSALPWYQRLEHYKVPLGRANTDAIQQLSKVAQEALSESDLQLVASKATLIDETIFNERVDHLGSKGQLLSSATMNLVAELLAESTLSAEVYCDRQGGRKNYMPILMESFPNTWFQETARTDHRCSYRTTKKPSIDIHFSVGGDRFPPTALASMLAKYLRERFMESFNDFWREKIPTLKPTAGYPLDAKRFRAAIEPHANELGLPLHCWWRSR